MAPQRSLPLLDYIDGLFLCFGDLVGVALTLAERRWKRKRKIFTLQFLFPSISNKVCAQPGSAHCSLHLSPHLCSAGRLSIISLLTFHHSVGGTQSESGDEEKIKEAGTELTQACVVRCDWVLEAEPCFMKLRANLTLQTKRMETMRGN